MLDATAAQETGRLAGGSDWPVDPLLPFTPIATAIDRSDPEENQPPLNAREGLTRASRWSCTPRARRTSCMTGTREPFDRANGPT